MIPGRLGVLLIVAVLAPARTLLAGSIVRVPLDVPTIAEALALAGEGGSIHVAEGTHAGGFVITQSVTIAGGYPADFEGEADPWAHPTVIVGSVDGNAVNAVLTTGDAVSLSGVICSEAVVAIDASLTGDAQLTLNTVTCQGNARGMRIDGHDSAGLFGTLVFLLDNTFDGAGAGLYAQVDGEAIMTISASEIAGNRASAGGAGAAVEIGGSAALSFIDVTFAGNGYPAGVEADLPGTILYSLAASAALFLDASRVAGSIPAVPGNAAVGGTQTDESLVQIVETDFREGQNSVGGEAIAAQVAGTAALRILSSSFEDAVNLLAPLVKIVADEQAVVFLLRNRFADNTSATNLVTTEQLGATFVSFDGNVLRANTTAGEVIAMSVSSQAAGALLRAINNQVSENDSTLGSGGGRFSVDGPNVAQVGHNTFVNNASISGVAGIHLIASASSPAQVSNNVAVGNLAGGIPADLSVEGFLAKSFGNFLTGDGDPGFRSIELGDFRLLADSVLRDAGHADAFVVDHDFEEDDRPFGDAFDIGSDEFVIRLGDLNCDGVINAFDIDPFVLALTDPDGYAAEFPNCSADLADINEDGAVDAFDIDPFVELLIAG